MDGQQNSVLNNQPTLDQLSIKTVNIIKNIQSHLKILFPSQSINDVSKNDNFPHMIEIITFIIALPEDFTSCDSETRGVIKNWLRIPIDNMPPIVALGQLLKTEEFLHQLYSRGFADYHPARFNPYFDNEDIEFINVDTKFSKFTLRGEKEKIMIITTEAVNLAWLSTTISFTDDSRSTKYLVELMLSTIDISFPDIETSRYEEYSTSTTMTDNGGIFRSEIVTLNRKEVSVQIGIVD
ncbi:hypothetical protein COLO4_35460 [Corchorus olitorius]|uniref:Uncharacterized protein n=1 Tax=Corchorus olitorius TaxID=93759 RepID=A0A1R3GGR2_9ROSI|nr:hypothetical protein COLO4_35460 [Corchorus olitorius]